MINMNAELFKKYTVEGELPVLVDFSADWCVYCRRIAPAVNKIAEQYADKLAVGTVNIDNEPLLAQKEQIEVIPTLVLYHKGKVLGSIVAPESKARLESFINETLSK